MTSYVSESVEVDRMSDIMFLNLCSCIVCLVTSYVFLDKLKWKAPLYRYLLLMIVNSCIVGMIGILNFPFFKIIAVILDGLILGILLGKYRGKKLAEFVFFAILIGFCEFISYPILIYLQTLITNFQSMNLQISGALMVSSQILILYLYQLHKHIVKEEKEKIPLFVSIFQILILPVFTLINLVFMILLSTYYLLPWVLLLMFLDIVFVISLNVYLFFLIDKMEENHRLREKAVLLEEMSKMQYTYYHQLEEKYQSSRGVIHDVKRHLQVLENKELPKDSVSDYIHDMKAMLDGYSQEVYSKHPIINIILHEKFAEANKANIEVDCRIAPVDFSFLKEIDATVIFANLLDNAIDACKEVNEKRTLQLQIEQIHDFLVIMIKNSSSCKHTSNGSTKAGHAGLGLQNVRQTLEKYGGYMQVESDEHEFKSHLYIPMI